MADLRKSITRLARERVDLRPHLLPILKEGGALQWTVDEAALDIVFETQMAANRDLTPDLLQGLFKVALHRWQPYARALTGTGGRGVRFGLSSLSGGVAVVRITRGFDNIGQLQRAEQVLLSM